MDKLMGQRRKVGIWIGVRIQVRQQLQQNLGVVLMVRPRDQNGLLLEQQLHRFDYVLCVQLLEH